MSGEPIQQVKHSLRFVISQLGADDSLSITTFSNESDLVLPLTKVNTTLKDTTIQKINNIQAKGSTNLSSGLLRAIQQLSDHTDTSKIILLFTDGNMNLGITKNQDLLDAIHTQIGDRNVPIYSMGYGATHNSELLTLLSNNGAYYFIENIDMIPTTFGKCIGGLLSIVAQNVTISLNINTNTTYTIDNVLSPFKITGDHISKSIYMGDLYAGETKNIPVTFKLPKLDQLLDTLDICTVSINYYDVQEKKFNTTSHNVTITHSTEKCPKNQNVLIHKNRIAVSNAIQRANELANQLKLDEAKQHLEQLQTVLQLSPIHEHPITVMLLQEIQSCIDSMKTRDTYRSLGHNYMNTVSQGIRLERQTTGLATCYMTPFQSKMERASTNYITKQDNIFDLANNQISNIGVAPPLYPGAVQNIMPIPDKPPLPKPSILRQYSV
jgi:hypothetical protein